jgi:hypothetical protein
MGKNKFPRWEISKWEGRIKHWKINKMTQITISISIITLNVNGLHCPNKRHILRNWIKSETWPFVAYKKHFTGKDKHRHTNIWKGRFQAIRKETKKFTLYFDKGNNQQEKITIVNIFSTNIVVPNFIKQTLLDIKAQIDLPPNKK